MNEADEKPQLTPARLLSLLGRVSAGSLAVKIGTVLLGLTVSVLLARVLGPEQFGIYSWALACLTMLVRPVQRGLGQLLVREISAYRLDEKWAAIRGLLRRTDQAALALLGAMTLIGGALLWGFSSNLNAAEITTLGWGFALLPFMALANLRGSALRGFSHVLRGQLPERVLRRIFLILIVGGAALVSQLSAQSAMAIHVLAAGGGLLCGIVLLRLRIPAPVHQTPPSYDTKRWMSSVLPLSLVAGVQIINTQADIALLGFFVPSQDVGIYRVVVKGSRLGALAIQAVEIVVAPYISQLYSENRYEELQTLLIWAARAVLIVSLGAIGGLVLFGEPILGFLFGSEYVAGYTALTILCVGQLINVSGGSVAILLNMTGFERDTAVGLSAAAALNIVLNLILIPRFGIEGAAVATVVTFLVSNAVLCERAYRRLGLVTTAFDWRRVIPS